MFPSVYVLSFHWAYLKEKTSCRVQNLLVSFTLLWWWNTHPYTYSLYTHKHKQEPHIHRSFIFFFFLLENKQPNVTNLVINFIYHISTHSCTPIFYLSVHAMRRRRFNRMFTRASKEFVLFSASFFISTLLVLYYWKED